MGCASCGLAEGGKPRGCQSNGHCGSGGCNRLNTYDWLSSLPLPDNASAFNYMEVSFKNGSRKGFFHNNKHLDVLTGDMVVVESATGRDVGRVSLSGELVRLQMKKKKVPTTHDSVKNIIRKASESDVQTLDDLRKKETETMIKARVIARDLKLDMKIGDVEYQGDGRKVTIYYTAEDRVDFRELIKLYAKEFKVKIEMRQIGARQESSRIGGMGDCGRELCCSTWLTDFKSVSTTAARYQNMAINQAKLSGQCGRLKCCLNYELDTYLDAIKEFPEDIDMLQTEAGDARLVKTDIFKQLMYFQYKEGVKQYALSVDQVKEIAAQNAKGKKPVELSEFVYEKEEEEELEFEDVVGQISLRSLERASKKRKKRSKSKGKKEDGRGPENKQTKGGRDNQGKKQQGRSQPQSRKKGKQQGQAKQEDKGRQQSQAKQDDKGGNKADGGNRKGKGRRPNRRKGGGNRSQNNPT